MSEQTPQDRREMRTILVASGAAVLLLVALAALAFRGLAGGPGASTHPPRSGLGRSQQAACMSNLRQIATATMMYCQDYDEHLPAAHNWCDATDPYVRNQNVYVCPSLPQVTCGYAYNAALDRIAVKTVTSPASTVASFDALGGWNLAGGAGLAEPRHSGGLNVAYADGHAKWHVLSDLQSLTWNPPPATGTGATGTATTGPGTPP